MSAHECKEFPNSLKERGFDSIEDLDLFYDDMIFCPFCGESLTCRHKHKETYFSRGYLKDDRMTVNPIWDIIEVCLDCGEKL